MSKVPTNAPNWPPKSPHEALLASPSRKKRLENARQREVSPSPVKRSGSTATARALQESLSDDDEEDEETLQLKLEAIEARLKLKKLQQAKKSKQAKLAEEERDRPSTAASSRSNASYQPSTVQVPLSPTGPRKPTEEPKSPARVLLGIDKGVRAQDVSLKRASSFTARLQAAQSNSRSNSRASNTTSGTVNANVPKGKSFSERIAESRQTDREREEKEKRLQQNRSTGFGLKSAESVVHKSRSLADMRNAVNTPSAKVPSPIAAASVLRPSFQPRKESEDAQSSDKPKARSVSSSTVPSAEPADSSMIDSFSGLHLSKRTTAQGTIAKHLAGMDLFTIPQLLKVVKSPHYDPPEVDGDYVVLGAIASKTSPINHKKKVQMTSNGDPDEKADDDQAAGRAKFMVLKLTDLKWEIDVFLFGTGFSHFWKLTVGTIVAVLNPGILPPVNKDTGKFSLKITSSEDTIIEIGSARDLGFCNAMKADGKDCQSWVDARKTEVCEYHISLAVDKAKRGRMEVNTMTGHGGRPQGGHGMFGGRGKKDFGGTKRSDELRREGVYRDQRIKETMYIASGASAAHILDAQERDIGGALERGMSRAELSRKRLAEKEKERELAKRLGSQGSGIGGEYMRLKGGGETVGFEGATRAQHAQASGFEKLDAGELGLLSNKAEDVSLGPTKRKRGTHSSSEPVGWGGAYKRGLPSPVKKPASRDTREPSPVKKKARLLLDGKGIREPGRESLGGAAATTALVDLDDDDDLEII